MTFSNLRLYSRSIGRVPCLGLEEEQRLARLYRLSGSAAAADRLVTANLKFVVKVAYQYRSAGVDIADLIQEGNIGLMKAIQRFDPEKGIRLTSYAVLWIRAQILNHILKSYSLVRLGTTQVQRKLFFSLRRTRHELDRPGGGQDLEATGASSREIAKKLRVKPAEVESMSQRLEGRDLSLDAPANRAEERTHLDLLAGHGFEQDDELGSAQEHSAVQKHVEEALAKLDRRERSIIEMRCMADEPSTLRELGERLGLSGERTRQLEGRAKKKLKQHLRALAAEIEWPARGAPTGSRATPWRDAAPRPGAARATG